MNGLCLPRNELQYKNYNMTKNKYAQHLGKLSAAKRKKDPNYSEKQSIAGKKPWEGKSKEERREILAKRFGWDKPTFGDNLTKGK